MNLFMVLLFVIMNLYLISADLCNEFRTCGECIGNQNRCAWCSAKIYTEPRCQSERVLEENKNWCKNNSYNPQPNEHRILKDAPLKSATNGQNDNVQFRPQKMFVKARPGVHITFNMSYKPAQDYPLDIYYLMDSSHTMRFHQEKLKSQAKIIYDKMIRITNNVRFGVGSFVEKGALPFGRQDKSQDIGATAFTNYLSLTEDIDDFSTTVGGVKNVGNYDTPEAGLDGLMQAMVCEEIKWRSDSRRIIILSTDSTYHSAGDGKMVGAFKPNDMECHLNNNTYEKKASLLYDYPSVNQINKVAFDKQITIIFAVLQSVKSVYEALSAKIQGSICVELSEKSDIPDMIEEQYNKLVRDLKIKRENVPSHINLLLDPPCTTQKTCTYVSGQSVDIRGDILITECSDRTETFYIGPSGLKHDKLEVTVEVDCQCECEKKGIGEKDSPMCNKAGIYQCGVCKCNNGRHGDTCECEGDSTIADDIRHCKAKEIDAVVCSGRGECSCGTCMCENNNYYGDFCEFSVKDCPFHDGLPCGGHGRCEQKACNCTLGWTGDDCSCSTNTDVCVAPNGKVCSGNGNCNCGVCKCEKLNSKNKPYKGKFCNYCEDCFEERCIELGPFVECYYNSSCNETLQHFNYNVSILNRTEINVKHFSDEYRCKRTLADGTAIIFKFHDEDNSTMILIQKDKELAPEANIWIPVAIAIGTILLIGLITGILWKILVDIHDAREYDRFANAAKADGFDVKTINPTYIPPTININNPAYAGNNY